MNTLKLKAVNAKRENRKPKKAVKKENSHTKRSKSYYGLFTLIALKENTSNSVLKEFLSSFLLEKAGQLLFSDEVKKAEITEAPPLPQLVKGHKFEVNALYFPRVFVVRRLSNNGKLLFALERGLKTIAKAGTAVIEFTAFTDEKFRVAPTALIAPEVFTVLYQNDRRLKEAIENYVKEATAHLPLSRKVSVRRGVVNDID